MIHRDAEIMRQKQAKADAKKAAQGNGKNKGKKYGKQKMVK